MYNIDFSSLRPVKRQPTKKEAALYRRWVQYLSNSKLSEDEIHKRAEYYTVLGEQP